MEVDFVPEIVWFRLPEDVIREVFDGLATDRHTLIDGQGIDETINIDGPSQNSSTLVVVIQTSGKFTREQLEAMRWLWNLHETCDSGKRCASWVLTTVKEVVDADSEVGGMAMELLENGPYTKLDGIGFDYTNKTVTYSNGDRYGMPVDAHYVRFRFLFFHSHIEVLLWTATQQISAKIHCASSFVKAKSSASHDFQLNPC